MKTSEAISQLIDVGASREAIQRHYDVSNDFYKLWLDPTMTYSCALFKKEDDDLLTAQEQKLDFHIHQANARGAERVLDVGCGWGACVNRLTQKHGVAKAVGLTLSEAQRQYVVEMNNPKVECRLESWTEHTPEKPYDAIISVGAIEHFARPEDSSEKRVEIYRRFFAKCHDMLVDGGCMSLQTILYNTGCYVPNSAMSKIFPQSDMPRLSEIALAADRLFSIDKMYNHGDQYAKTVRFWIDNIKKHKEQLIEIGGEETYNDYLNYLYVGAKGFDYDVFSLARFKLRKVKPLY